MKILLTGADGFTGRHFGQRARQAGHEVVALRADLRQRDALAAEVAASDADTLVHLAAISFVAHHDDRELYDVNLFGTLNLLEAAGARPRPWRKVFISSSANVYGNCEHSPIPEEQAPAPVNHYAMSKLAMEHMARARAGALPLVLARPFNYTGPGQSPQFVIPKLVEHFGRRAPTIAMGNLEVEREYNDVRMVCEAYLMLLRDGVEPGTYNVCTGRTYSLRSVVGLLESLTGHRATIEVHSAFVRPNEVHRLCGDPARLQAACPDLPRYELVDTLRWMLEAGGPA